MKIKLSKNLNRLFKKKQTEFYCFEFFNNSLILQLSNF